MCQENSGPWYVEWDEEFLWWGVFHEDTGSLVATFCVQEEAEEHANLLNVERRT